MADIKIMTDVNYKGIIEGNKAVLVDLYADWCGPCKMLSPVIEEVADEMDGVTFAKLNVDQNPGIANALHANTIPYLVLFVDGKVKETTVGFRPKDDLVEWLKKSING